MTERLFMDNARLAACDSRVLIAEPERVVLDRTVFYARSGGQAGDIGILRWNGAETTVADTVKGEVDTVLHVPAPNTPLPPPGTQVRALIDWPRRYALMRMHTTLHLLCSLLPGAGVTGGAVGPEKSRLDFDLPAPPPRDEIEHRLNALIAEDLPVSISWVDEAVLDTEPGLVRTMSVRPPRGAGRLRLVRIGAEDASVDLQPCGGTHVARTAEIGRVAVLKMESKGKQNRRIVVALAE